LIAFVIVLLFIEKKKKIKIKIIEYICANCGYKGRPKTLTKGSFSIEIVLWLFFIIPGLIYSLWRLTSRYKACPKCKMTNMVPISTPRGQKLLKEFYPSKI